MSDDISFSKKWTWIHFFGISQPNLMFRSKHVWFFLLEKILSVLKIPRGRHFDAFLALHNLVLEISFLEPSNNLSFGLEKFRTIESGTTFFVRVFHRRKRGLTKLNISTSLRI